MWVENKVGKGIFFKEIKGDTERTGVQRFGTRYVEINAVKDFPIFPFKFSVITGRLD